MTEEEAAKYSINHQIALDRIDPNGFCRPHEVTRLAFDVALQTSDVVMSAVGKEIGQPYKKRIEDLENKVSGLASAARVSENQQKIDSLCEQLKSMRGQIDRLEQKLGAKDKQIQALEKKIPR